jgi:lambda family phage minor tail protein L
MASSIAAELLKLSHSAIIQLYEVDVRPLGGALHRFAPQVNGLSGAIVWQGNTYTPFPITADGFEQQRSGPLPRPRVTVSNVLGVMGALNRGYGNLEGAVFTRRRTLARFLDAVNFPGGVNATADPTAAYPDDVWMVDRKSHQDRSICTYELASPADLAGFKLPARQVLARRCGWVYRTSECGYTGGPVAKIDDTPTSLAAEDRCSQSLTGCRLRFGSSPDGLPFGGFPGAGLLRQA